MDVDDCNTDNGTCSNTVGAFTCACNTGFGGDGVVCTGELVGAAFVTSYSRWRLFQKPPCAGQQIGDRCCPASATAAVKWLLS